MRSSFSAAARSLVSRARSAATSIAPDRSSSTVAVRTDSDAVGANPSAGGLEPGQRPDQRLVRGEPVAVEPAEPGGDPLRGPQPLIGPEPAHLGDHVLQRRDLGLGGRVEPGRVGLRPGRDHQRLAAGQRRPQRLGDERHHRVQQPQHGVQHVAEHQPGAPGRPRRRPASGTLASSTYQSQNSSQTKW